MFDDFGFVLDFVGLGAATTGAGALVVVTGGGAECVVTGAGAKCVVTGAGAECVVAGAEVVVTGAAAVVGGAVWVTTGLALWAWALRCCAAGLCVVFVVVWVCGGVDAAEVELVFEADVPPQPATTTATAMMLRSARFMDPASTLARRLRSQGT